MELTELKHKILSLLAQGDATKTIIAKTVWETSSRKLSLALSELVAEGKIYKIGTKYTLKKKKTVKKSVVKEVAKSTHDLSIGVLRIVFLIIAVATTIISMRNVSVYLATVYPFPFWLLFSGVLILFIITGVSSTMYLWGHKMRPLAVCIGLVAIIGVFYSITCTVIGMYNAEKELFVTKTTNTRIDNALDAEYNTSTDQIKAVEDLIADKRTTLKRYNELILEADSVRAYNALDDKITKAEQFISEKTTELSVLRGSIQKVTQEKSSTKTEAPDFGEQVGSIIGLSGAVVSFIVHIIGAIILEILNPISTYLALFMSKKGE